MNAAFVAFAGQDSKPRVGEPVVESTVYLRRQARGWVVSLDEVLLLSTMEEDEAFCCACDARRVEGGEPLRLLILSGPSAVAYPWPAVNPNEVQAVAHDDRNGGAAPDHLAGVAA